MAPHSEGRASVGTHSNELEQAKNRRTDRRPRFSRLTQPRRFKVVVPHISHGYNDNLVVTLYPTGALVIRETRRRQAPVLLELGHLYVNARVAEARQKRQR